MFNVYYISPGNEIVFYLQDEYKRNTLPFVISYSDPQCCPLVCDRDGRWCVVFIITIRFAFYVESHNELKLGEKSPCCERACSR